MDALQSDVAALSLSPSNLALEENKLLNNIIALGELLSHHREAPTSEAQSSETDTDELAMMLHLANGYNTFIGDFKKVLSRHDLIRFDERELRYMTQSFNKIVAFNRYMATLATH